MAPARRAVEGRGRGPLGGPLAWVDGFGWWCRRPPSAPRTGGRRRRRTASSGAGCGERFSKGGGTVSDRSGRSARPGTLGWGALRAGSGPQAQAGRSSAREPRLGIGRRAVKLEGHRARGRTGGVVQGGRPASRNAMRRARPLACGFAPSGRSPRQQGAGRPRPPGAAGGTWLALSEGRGCVGPRPTILACHHRAAHHPRPNPRAPRVPRGPGA